MARAAFCMPASQDYGAKGFLEKQSTIIRELNDALADGVQSGRLKAAWLFIGFVVFTFVQAFVWTERTIAGTCFMLLVSAFVLSPEIFTVLGALGRLGAFYVHREWKVRRGILRRVHIKTPA